MRALAWRCTNDVRDKPVLNVGHGRDTIYREDGCVQVVMID